MVAISFSGLVILLKVHDNVHLQYGALFLVAMGTFSAMPIVLCWYSANRECNSCFHLIYKVTPLPQSVDIIDAQ